MQKVTSYSNLTECDRGLSNTGLLSSCSTRSSAAVSRAFLQPGLQELREQRTDQRMLINGQSPSSQIAIFTSLIRMCPYCKQWWFPPPPQQMARSVGILTTWEYQMCGSPIKALLTFFRAVSLHLLCIITPEKTAPSISCEAKCRRGERRQ